jgi:vacuolar-type H+-ATPase subunit D/Vma8
VIAIGYLAIWARQANYITDRYLPSKGKNIQYIELSLDDIELTACAYHIIAATRSCNTNTE